MTAETRPRDLILEATGLSFTYPATAKGQGRKALDGITLGIERGTIFGIIGPSRSGKSTFLRLINRLQEVTAPGRVEGSLRF